MNTYLALIPAAICLVSYQYYTFMRDYWKVKIFDELNLHELTEEEIEEFISKHAKKYNDKTNKSLK